jgi:hypothetical protein
MSALIIGSGYAWGQLTNRLSNGLISANTQMERLNDAIATASSGFTGVAGTQFEVSQLNNMSGAIPSGDTPNLFGVLASETPGEQGEGYAYAVGRLHELWQTFWTAASPFIEQLDNGSTMP